MSAQQDSEPLARRRRQQAAMEAWNRHAELLIASAEETSGNREARMDAQRHVQALRRTQQVLAERARSLAPEGAPDASPLAVLVHRNAWMRDKLGTELQGRGVQVRGDAEDGADGLGIAIAEQPDLVVVEDRLPSLSAVQVVTAVREFASHALVAAQVEHEEDVDDLLAAGVSAVFGRRVPPAVMAEELHAMLLEPPARPLLVS